MRHFILILLFTISVLAETNVTVQLPGIAQFEFGAFYMAKEKGFYKKEGLDVSLLYKKPGNSLNAGSLFLKKRIDYAVIPYTKLPEIIKAKHYILLSYLFQSSIRQNDIDGYNFYDDFLITSKDKYQKNPLKARQFVMATLKGWRYALSHIDESAKIIHSKYAPDKSVGELEHEAKSYLKRNILDTKKIGLIDPDRLKQMLLSYKKNKKIKNIPNITNFTDPLFLDILPLSMKQRRWMAHNIITYSETTWPPFVIIKGNKAEGIVQDYLRLIQQKSGLIMKFVPQKSWSGVLKKVKSKKLDMAIATGKTQDREQYAIFSNPYDTYNYGIATKNDKGPIIDIQQLKGKIIAVGTDYTADIFLKNNYPFLQLKQVKTTNKALKMLSDGRVDAVIDILPVLSYFIAEKGLKEIIINGSFKEEFILRAMFKKDDEIAMQIFNLALSSITPKEKRDIVNRWSKLVAHYNTYGWLVFPLAITMILILLLLYYIFKSKMEFKKRTKMENEISAIFNIIDNYVLMSKTDINGNITYVSQAFCDLTGYSKEELIGKNHKILKNPDTSDKMYKKIKKTLLSGKSWHTDELKNHKKDGSVYYVDVTITPVRDKKGKIIFFLAIRKDITPYKKMEILASHDALTQIYNRRFFNKYMASLLPMAVREGANIGFAIFDVDNFKDYNDTYGHDAGDSALIKITHEVSLQCQRATDKIFRLGGEEFGIVMLVNDISSVAPFMKDVVKAVKNLHIPHKKNIPYGVVTISLGTAVFQIAQGESINLDTIYTKADQLMYRAKKSGKNRSVVEIISSIEPDD